MVFTEYDNIRMIELLKKTPSLKNLQEIIEDNIKNKEDFTLRIGPDWEKRQFAHIIASKNGWNSAKILTNNYDFGRYQGKCGRCKWLLEPPEDWEHNPGYCCAYCDGYCPNGCGSHHESTGAVWIGDVLFSQNHLKLGRQTRKNKNKWKNGLK